MHNSRLRATLATGLATLAIGLVGIGVVASPAAAAGGRALPEGSALYAVSCDSELADLSFFSVDTVTAAATPIGPGTPASDADCAGQAAYDPATSTSYFIAYLDEATFLATVDVATGLSSPVGSFSIDGIGSYVDSMAIGTDGAAYAIVDSTLFSIDLGTAALTELGDLGDIGGLYGFSVDPTTGQFYAVQPSGDIYTIDVAAHTATLLVNTQLGGGNNNPYSLQIDAAGTFWLEADFSDAETDYYSNLWSISGADLAASAILSGAITAPEGTFYTETLLIVPGPVVPVIPAEPVVPAVVEPAAVIVPVAPQLANTGVDAAPIAAGGALVALLGVALLVPAIRRRATA